MKDVNFVGNARECVDILGNKWKCDCVGCAIANGEIESPGGIIHDGKSCVLTADLEIPLPGFLVISAKRQINSFSELEKSERDEIGDIIACAEKALRDLGITEQITLVQEERSVHFHVWIFPNYPWMNEKFGRGIKYLRDISEYCQQNSSREDTNKVLEVVDKIRGYFEQHYRGA